MLYQSSLNKGGDFANQVISNIAQGNYGQVGSIKGADAQKAFTSYMGINPGGGSSYDNVEIGGGRITGTETGSSGNRDFALYHADQYAAPTQAPTLRYSPWMVPPGTSSMHRIRSKKHHILPAAAK